ncbi:MAG: molecular chaperone DjiA [Pseudomonadota bacterium]
MSIWSRIADALSSLAQGESLAQVFERLRTPPEKSVGFTIAVIALGAKMAKADGRVTRDEVAAFREVFDIPPAAEASAAKVFNLARQDVAGFDEYARRISSMFGTGHDILKDLLEGLFHIAMADGTYHPDEDVFLQNVADIFGLADLDFRKLRARFVPNVAPDPYEVLGASPSMPLPEIRKLWHDLVLETHPDRLAARGVPDEARRLAEARLIAVNKAWHSIQEAQKPEG